MIYKGTNKDDSFYLRDGGIDSVFGQGGDDFVGVYRHLRFGDRFDGGEGTDALLFGRGLPDGFAFDGDNLVNFETIYFTRHARCTIADACDPAGHNLRIDLSGHGYDIDASAVNGSLTVSIDNLAKNNRAYFVAGSGDDTISGGFGRDHLDGGAGNDTIYGSFGYDRINGGAGDDTIQGGSFGNKLTGGTGADTFVYPVGQTGRPSIEDIITDFAVSEDKLLIYSSYLHDYSQLQFEDDGHGGTFVLFNNGTDDSVDLRHVERDTLSASNFTFVTSQSPTQPADGPWRQFAFDPLPHVKLADMAGAHAGFGNHDIIAHAAMI